MRSSSTSTFTILFLLLASSSDVVHSQTISEWHEELGARLDPVIDASISEDGPGIAMLIARDGEVVYERYKGMANVETSIRIGPDTAFRLASVSKIFTALAIMQLHEEERLSLDDSIRTYLPDVPEDWDKVTIRNVIEHRSGIPDFGDVADVTDPEETFFPAEFDNEFIRSEFILGLELEFEPGTIAEYSNTGYILLAEIVEVVSGGGFDEYMQRHIFEPLDMTASFINDGDIEPHTLGALSYGTTQKIFGRYATHTGSSSQVGSVRDLQKFVAGLLDGRIVAPPTLELMRQRHSRWSDEIFYGYGLLISNTYRAYGHTGSYDGVEALLLIDFASDSYIIVLMNSGDALEFRPLLDSVLPFPSR